jgi:carboxymethylenebutenolidase
MIPEDQGLSAWAMDMADEIAGMGYIVIVPDFLSGRGPNDGGQPSFGGIKAVMYSLIHIKEPELTGDMNAWADYGNRLPGSNHKLAVVGFGWGGGRAFWWATQRHDLTRAFIFYDTAPPAPALAGISAPVYAFYADHDARVTRQLDAVKANMTAAGKKYEAIRYPDSDHMFVRLGDEPGNTNPGNIQARTASLAKLQDLLASM